MGDKKENLKEGGGDRGLDRGFNLIDDRGGEEEGKTERRDRVCVGGVSRADG